MLRTFFSALGVLFAALLLFCASFLGNVAADLDRARDDYGAVAVDATRELSLTWKMSAIEQRYAAEAQQELSPVLDADLEGLTPLGRLLNADNVRVVQRWSEPRQHPYAPAAMADRLAALISRSVKVTFTGKFAGGVAQVTAELKRENGAIKLCRLRIDSHTPPPPPDRPERRAISHA